MTDPNTVYVVIQEIEYEGQRFLGVYSTREKAQAEVDRLYPEHSHWSKGISDMYCYEREGYKGVILAVEARVLDTPAEG